MKELKWMRLASYYGLGISISALLSFLGVVFPGLSMSIFVLFMIIAIPIFLVLLLSGTLATVLNRHPIEFQIACIFIALPILFGCFIGAIAGGR